jgi:hypothetical protein
VLLRSGRADQLTHHLTHRLDAALAPRDARKRAPCHGSLIRAPTGRRCALSARRRRDLTAVHVAAQVVPGTRVLRARMHRSACRDTRSYTADGG